jgi:hypothetical protein
MMNLKRLLLTLPSLFSSCQNRFASRYFLRFDNFRKYASQLINFLRQ